MTGKSTIADLRCLAAHEHLDSPVLSALLRQAADELEAVYDSIKPMLAIKYAAINLIKQRGRYNTEQAYQHLFYAVELEGGE